MDTASHREQAADAALELLAEMKHPDMFEVLMDSLPAGPERALLRLWGVAHHAYPTTETSEEALRQALHELAQHPIWRPPARA
jgi:hypothetical protein